MHRVSSPSSIYSPTRTLFNSVQKPQLGAIRFQSCLSDYTELSASTLIPVKNPQLGAPANQVWEPTAPSWPLAPSFSLPRRGYKLAFQEMIRNPHPNREMDRNPYWSLDEISLTVIVKIRQNTEYFHQTTNQCPNCGANCWEATFQSFSADAPAPLWHSPHKPLSMITGKLTSGPKPSPGARKELLQQLKRELN